MRFFGHLAAAAASATVLLPTHAHAQGDIAAYLYERALRVPFYLFELVMAAYHQAPAFVLVLGALLVVPAMVIVALFVQGLVRFISWRRRLRAPRQLPDLEDWAGDSTPRTGVPAWPAQAWLTVDGEEEESVPIDSAVVSIGRHEDNVLYLHDSSVHRFHAVIHRNDDAQFVITDVSGEDGSGVRINGERQVRAHLVNGDRIELGSARLTFAAVPH